MKNKKQLTEAQMSDRMANPAMRWIYWITYIAIGSIILFVYQMYQNIKHIISLF